MREAGDELAHRLHLLALHQGFLRGAQFAGARFHPCLQRGVQLAQLFGDRCPLAHQAGALGDLLHEGNVIGMPIARRPAVEIDDRAQPPFAQEWHDQDGAGINRARGFQAARVDPRIGGEQIAHHHGLTPVERGHDAGAEIGRRHAPQQRRGRAIGPADIVIEHVLFGQQLAKAGAAHPEMLAHQRGNLVQRGGGIVIAQDIGDLEPQRDARLTPGDLVEHSLQPGRAQCDGQNQQRDRGDQHGQKRLADAAGHHVRVRRAVHGDHGSMHAGIVHAGNRQAHQPGRAQPHAQRLVPRGKPQRSGGRTDRDQHRNAHPQPVIMHGAGHAHRRHAHVMHRHHAQTHQQPGRGDAPG